MFEKFTEGAIKVIMLAQEEARRMGHNFVGTEQLLLGVIGQRHGIGGRALTQLNVTLDDNALNTRSDDRFDVLGMEPGACNELRNALPCLVGGRSLGQGAR
mgnify:CR=1 FL=1